MILRMKRGKFCVRIPVSTRMAARILLRVLSRREGDCELQDSREIRYRIRAFCVALRAAKKHCRRMHLVEVFDAEEDFSLIVSL